MESSELRKKFLESFEERGHIDLASSSLIPENDPSVLFTTAGMQQFKRYYLFPDEAPSARIVTIQKCLRTGDIDEVGDKSHLTFFEMLGNFSFGYKAQTDAESTRNDADGSGPYFKPAAIKWAWEFLTEKLEISKDRISAAYFKGEDDIPADEESLKIIKDVTGFSDDKIKGTGKDETFWSLGTEGSPGGPTVEFYVDGIEVWNLVFNEYVIRNGKYVESKLKGVDTGMGLDRLTMVMQGKSDIYETDLFAPIIAEIEKISGKKYSDNQKEFRIIADHIRASIALIADGVIPSNKDQGYILRRLIRRAIVQANNLGVTSDFTSPMVDCLASIYQPINQQMESIKAGLLSEEDKFRKTLASGLQIIKSRDEFSGKTLFDLYQTYGIPVEVVAEEAKRLNRSVSGDEIVEFNNLMQQHQEKSRTASAGMFKGGLADNKVETTRLHTAAHLLLAALRQVLSPDVNQKGSNITEERLRFDFNWPEKLTSEQISQVENVVNEKIKENLPVEMEELSLEDAKKSAATGVFDDRYGPKGAPFGDEKVKVYTIGEDPSTRSARSGPRDFVSREICGGPHVKNISELGTFKITKEESSSAGIRRIKAVLE